MFFNLEAAVNDYEAAITSHDRQSPLVPERGWFMKATIRRARMSDPEPALASGDRRHVRSATRRKEKSKKTKIKGRKNKKTDARRRDAAGAPAVDRRGRPPKAAPSRKLKRKEYDEGAGAAARRARQAAGMGQVQGPEGLRRVRRARRRRQGRHDQGDHRARQPARVPRGRAARADRAREEPDVRAALPAALARRRAKS